MTSEIDDLTLRFPARPGYLVISRLNAAALGTAAGFDVEELDDLRLAVTEVITWLLADAAAGGDVELRLAVADGRIEIDGSRSGAGLAPNPADELVEVILGATVDEFELTETGGDERRIRLTKAKAPVDAG